MSAISAPMSARSTCGSASSPRVPAELPWPRRSGTTKNEIAGSEARLNRLVRQAVHADAVEEQNHGPAGDDLGRRPLVDHQLGIVAGRHFQLFVFRFRRVGRWGNGQRIIL